MLLVSAPFASSAAAGGRDGVRVEDPVPVVGAEDVPAGFLPARVTGLPADRLWSSYTCEKAYAPWRVLLGRSDWTDGTRLLIVLTARIVVANGSDEGARLVQRDVLACLGSAPRFPVPGVADAAGFAVAIPDGSGRVVHVVVLRRGPALAVVFLRQPSTSPPDVAATVAGTQAARMGPGASAPASVPDPSTAVPETVGEMTGAAVVPIVLAIAGLELADRVGAARRARTRRRRTGTSPVETVDVSEVAWTLHVYALLSFVLGLVPALVGILGLTVYRIDPVGGSITVLVAVVLGLAVWLLGRGTASRRPRYRPTLGGLLVGTAGVALAGLGLWLFQLALWVYARADDVRELAGSAWVPLGFTVFALLVMAGAGGLWRFALRLSHTTPSRAVLRDPRPGVLYLRSFRDDELHIDVAPFARSGLAERLSGRRRQSFEEIVAEALLRRAPVVAVSEPRTWLPPLGFARESLGSRDWRDGVEERVAAAGAVVVLLGRSGGLDWEMRLLAESGAWRKTVVVIPPVPAADLLVRWAHLEQLLRDLGFGRVELPGEPPWLLALCFTPTGDCVFFTGRALTAWCYKAAVTEALKRALALPPSTGARPAG